MKRLTSWQKEGTKEDFNSMGVVQSTLSIQAIKNYTKNYSFHKADNYWQTTFLAFKSNYEKIFKGTF